MDLAIRKSLRFVLVVGAISLFLLGGCRSDEPDWIPIPVDDDGGTASRAKKSKPTRSARGESSASAAKPTAPDAAKESAARAIERGDVAALRRRAVAIHQALLRALPPSERALLADVPFVFTPSAGDVNAFAACTKRGAFITVTDGLMVVQAQLARAQATDEVFHTNKRDGYLALLARSAALLPPGAFINANQDAHPDKRRRQARLFDEGIAFVIAHELAHHRLSHTGCVGHDHDTATTADVGRLLSRRVPLFNQPSELASDVYGVENVLAAGAGEGTGWTEDGALLMLMAFRARTAMSLSDSLLFGFERTHPHPDVRIPVVEQTARAWRQRGGQALPKLPTFVLGELAG